MLKQGKKMTAITLAGIILSVMTAFPVDAAPIVLASNAGFDELSYADSGDLFDKIKGAHPALGSSIYNSKNNFEFSLADGIFGKDPGDKALRVYKAALAGTDYFAFITTAGGFLSTPATFDAGETFVLSWQHAWGMIDDAASFGVELGFVGGSPNYSFVSIAKTGAVTFAGSGRGTIPNYKRERWYDYQLVFKFTGTAAVTGTLYVDGVAYGENITLSGTGAGEGINHLRLAMMSSNTTVRPIGAKVDAYADNISAVKLPAGESLPKAPGANAITVTHPDVTFVDGVHSTSVRSMKTADLLEQAASAHGTVTLGKLVWDGYDTVATGYLRLNTLYGRQIFYEFIVNGPAPFDGAKEFDIVNFSLTGTGSNVGASADIYNWRSWERRTAVMVMTLSDSRGAVHRVYSSPVTTAYDITGAQVRFQIEIPPVANTERYDVKVFFMGDWEDYLIMKKWEEL